MQLASITLVKEASLVDGGGYIGGVGPPPKTI